LRIELIVVGDEILLGQTRDTNSAYIARRLTAEGLRLERILVVGDNQEHLQKALEASSGHADIVILTGGLGPTSDDVTRPVLADFLGMPLRFRQDLADGILDRFTRRGTRPSPGWESMAHFPAGAEPLPNSQGAAPGIFAQAGARCYYALPGVPTEMQPMFDRDVLPALVRRRSSVFKSCIFKSVGVGESHLEQKIGPAEHFRPATIAFLPSIDQGVTLRLSCGGVSEQDVESVLKRGAEVIESAVRESLYAREEIALEAVVIDYLRRKGLRLSLAESCTGGLIAERLTSVPGASDVFDAGLVTYSNDAKMSLLKVPDSLLTSFGAVSAECAAAMAEGARAVREVDLALSVTGVAGPGGGSPEKPVGLVFIALASAGGTVVERHHFAGGRDSNRRRSALAALSMLYRYLSRKGLPS